MEKKKVKELCDKELKLFILKKIRNQDNDYNIDNYQTGHSLNDYSDDVINEFFNYICTKLEEYKNDYIIIQYDSFNLEDTIKKNKHKSNTSLVIAYIATISLFDKSNLGLQIIRPYIIPGVIIISQRTKEHMERNKNILYREGLVNEEVNIIIYNSINISFTILQLMAIYQLFNLYGTSSSNLVELEFYKVLIIMISEYFYHKYQDLDNEYKASLRKKQIDLNRISNTINNYNQLKNYIINEQRIEKEKVYKHETKK